MKNILFIVLMAVLLVSCRGIAKEAEETVNAGPVQLHPENPHYFQYKGKTLALVTSAEHYGAVLNSDFDFQTYLETLSGAGMNYTRIFTGSYFEIPGESFGIRKNTLAPGEGRVITPWALISSENAQNKYDLTRWNEDYFNRLKSFMQLADDLDIIVEVTLFSSVYRDRHWEISPQNPKNNVNISDDIMRLDAHTLNNGELLQYQEMFVRKMVKELNAFNNFFFEIQNEPWADHPVGVYNIVNKEEIKDNDWTYKADFADEQAMEWQDKVISWIVDEESGLPKIHLIAQNYTNFKAPIPEVNEDVSIINFHYAWPEAVEWNYHYNRVIGFDESGFAGSGDDVYRRQAWKFMLSGGGLFNNLDYSFFTGNETGDAVNKAPGGGSQILREQLRILSEFLHSFPLEKMKPANCRVLASPGLIPHVLGDNKDHYAVYLLAINTRKSTLVLEADPGTWQVEFLDPVSGEYTGKTEVDAKEGRISFEAEFPEGELACRVTRKR